MYWLLEGNYGVKLSFLEFCRRKLVVKEKKPCVCTQIRTKNHSISIFI